MISPFCEGFLFTKLRVDKILAKISELTVLYTMYTKISLKKICDEVTEDLIDICNVIFFKDNEKKKWGTFILCYVLGQLSSVKRLA